MKALGNPRNSGDARTEVWLTPPFVIEALGGPASFDLDPCAPTVQPWPTALRTYTESDNGLVLPWEGRVWLNPPYATPLLRAFLQKMTAHGVGTALIFAKVETQAFFKYVWEHAHALLFIKSRLHFYDANGQVAPYNSGAPSVLVAYGAYDAEVLSDEPIEGKFIPLRVACSMLCSKFDTPTWREALEDFFAERKDAVPLSEIYEFFTDHPKTRGNANYREKIRQTLKRARFVNTGRGEWARAN